MGDCVGTPGHLQSQLSRVWPLGPTPWRTITSPVWSFVDQTWSKEQLRCLKAILLEMPLLFTLITSHLFSPGSLWIFFSGCFTVDLTAFVGASVFCLVLFFPSHIIYHNIPSEPATTVFLKTHLVQMPVFITYGGYLELSEWEIYLIRSFLPL